VQNKSNAPTPGRVDDDEEAAMASGAIAPQRSATWDEAAGAVISFFERLVTDDADVATVLA
jgi:hypothetical protein